jgi:adenylate kinase family enzyme
MQDKKKRAIMKMKLEISKAKRIAVVGIPGSGKTHLAKELARILNLPLFHMDTHFQGTKNLSMDERMLYILKSIDEETGKEKWIIDGNYPSHAEALRLRMERADLVFYLNLPIDFCIENIKKRGAKNIEAMNGLETEESITELVLQVQNYKQKNEKIKYAIRKYAPNKSIEFKKKGDVDELIEGLRTMAR